MKEKCQCVICKSEIEWDKDTQWGKPELCLKCVNEGYYPQMASNK